VNQAGRSVPADLPRVEFVHWLMADIPPEYTELAAGACSDGVVAHGNHDPFGPPRSVHGMKDFTGFFAGDADMVGEYLGYDGPCPPWNDTLLHHYHFTIHAIDVDALPLVKGYSRDQLRAAMASHVLDQATLTGVYSLNPAVAG
jgi:Raf kinase inhibitor-like YbhB/YbcL family protein